MGSYNETCALSNLPIWEEDRVVAILVCSSPYMSGGNVCNIADNMIPRSFIFRGEYVDCGELDNISFDDSIKSVLSQELFKSVKDENDNFMYSFQHVVYDNIDDFLRDVCAEEVFVKNSKLEYNPEKKAHENVDKYFPLNIMYMHEGLFDCLMKEMNSRIVYWEKDIWEKANAKKVKDSIKNFLNQYEEFHKYFGDNMLKILPELGNFIRLNNHLGFDLVKFLGQCLIEKKIGIDLAEQKLAEMLTFEMVLSNLRSGYFSYSGFGSQNTDMELHKLRAEWTLKFYEEKTNKKGK